MGFQSTRDIQDSNRAETRFTPSLFPTSEDFLAAGQPSAID
jgi:hypothetical protein